MSYAWKECRGNSFAVRDAFSQFMSFGRLRDGFDRVWSSEQIQAMRDRLPGLTPPRRVVFEYAEFLTGEGFLHSFGNGEYCVSEGPLREARDSTERTRETRSRRLHLDELTAALKAPLGKDADKILARWSRRPLPGTADSPLRLVEKGGGGWQDLVQALMSLGGMAQPGGAAIPSEQLLALPLEEIRQTRLAEAEKREAELTERRTRNAVSFLARLRAQAETEMTREQADAWFQKHVEPQARDLGSDDTFEAHSIYRRRMEENLEGALRRIRVAKDAEADRMLACANLELQRENQKDELRKAAFHAFGLASIGRVDLWMRSRHPALGGAPNEVCLSQEGMKRCTDLLAVVARRR